MMIKEFDYISENYLNRVSLSLLALNRVSDGELLSMEVFNAPLYELVYIATVSGVEEYLFHRLSLEVLDSDESIQRYIDVYNNHFRKRKPNQHLQYSPPFSDDDIEHIKETLAVKQTYHRLDIIKTYFHEISGFNTDDCPSWDKLKPIIANRHQIVHHGARDNNGDRITIKPYDVTVAYEVAQNFISEVEDAFVKMGKSKLIIDPRD